MDFVLKLPEELSLEVFRYLDARTCARCACVRRDWRRLASDGVAWKQRYRDLLPWCAANLPLSEDEPFKPRLGAVFSRARAGGFCEWKDPEASELTERERKLDASNKHLNPRPQTFHPL